MNTNSPGLNNRSIVSDNSKHAQREGFPKVGNNIKVVVVKLFVRRCLEGASLKRVVSDTRLQMMGFTVCCYKKQKQKITLFDLTITKGWRLVITALL